MLPAAIQANYMITPQIRPQPFPRFGMDKVPPNQAPQTPPASEASSVQQADTVDIGGKPKNSAPETPQQGYLKRMYLAFVAFMKAVAHYLWPPNWFMFQRNTAPAAVNQPAPAVAEQNAATTAVSTESNKPPAAVSEAEKPQAETPPLDFKEAPKEKKPRDWRKWVGFAFRMGLNAFHIGAAGFILAGAFFFHAPLWVMASSIIGLQLLQTWVSKRFPDADVLNKDHMKIVGRKITQKYDKAMVTALNLFRKIPLLGRLDKPVAWMAMKARKVFQKGVNYATVELIPNTVSVSQMPKDFWKKSPLVKMGYIAKAVLQQTLKVITGPFGHVGEVIYNVFSWLFRLSDVAEVVDAFATRKPGAPMLVKPKPASPPSPPGVA